MGTLPRAVVPLATARPRRAVWAAAPGSVARVHLGSSAVASAAFSTRRRLGSLLDEAPDVAAELHPTRNDPGLDPSEISASSHVRVWWKCSAGADHEWQASVSDRTREEKQVKSTAAVRRATGCPMCANKRVSSTNNLAITHPAIAAQFHPTKNAPDVRPELLVPGTARKVWFKCSAGPDHEWETELKHRTSGGTNCPFCANRRVSVTNCLSTVRPDVASDWDPEANGTLTPRDVTHGSNKVVNWRCAAHPNFKWRSMVKTRTHGRTRCRFCRGGRRPASKTG